LLRDLQLLDEYRTGAVDVVRGLYEPGLHQSTEYLRAVGFFSSSALEALGAPLGAFVAGGGRMRLVTSVRLSATDTAAIEAGLSRQQAVEDRLVAEIAAGLRAPLGKGAFLLTSLLAAGRLEIQVAVPLDGAGIYHEKLGIFVDSVGDFVAFCGSSNESRQAFEGNYECIDVYRSWSDGARASAKRSHFEALWRGTAPGVVTLTFPEAARRALLQRHVEEAERRERKPAFAGLWTHQRDAVQEFLTKKRGVLEMATGTGKTRTALAIAAHLLETGQVDTLVVAADGNDLLDQWYNQLLSLGRQMGGNFPILRHHASHRERDHFLLRPKHSAFLASRESLAPALRRLSRGQLARTLLVHDEVHRLGSPGNRAALAGLSEAIPFRLGLSATPDREYDVDGNSFIEAHVGPVIKRFELSDAIRNGVLTAFDYHPIDYVPSEEDRARLQEVYRRAAAKKAAGDPMTQEQIWTALAMVHKTSLAKIPPMSAFLAANAHLLRRAIVFVETREYGEKILELIHRYRHDFHTYYAEDDVGNLERFANGEIECLITCHRLSEGIDIRSIETVFLLSSARARLETIQRIGRCLRIDPENPRKRAHVIDFLRVGESVREDNADEARRAWLTSLSLVQPDGTPNAD
jgi:superfamily II DNA or RNA helicase